MTSKTIVVEIIYRALQALNSEQEAVKQVPLALDTCLFGPASKLDSLALVSVIVDVETAVADQLGRQVSLTDDEAMSEDVSPFSSVESLADYVVKRLAQP